VAAISIAGRSVSFPVGIGLGLAIGVIVNYVFAPVRNELLLFGRVAFPYLHGAYRARSIML